MQDFFNTYAPRLPPLSRTTRRGRLPQQTTGQVAQRIRQREALLDQLGIGPNSPRALNAGPGPGMGPIPMPAATVIDPQAARVSMASGLPQPSAAGAGFNGLPPMPPMAPVAGEASSILPNVPLAQQAGGATPLSPPPMTTAGGQGILPGIPSSQRAPSGVPAPQPAPVPAGQGTLPFGGGAAGEAGAAGSGAVAGAEGAAAAGAGALGGEAAQVGRLQTLRGRLGLGGPASTALSEMSLGQRLLPALGYYSMGQAGNQLAQNIPGSVHGVDVGDRSGNILGMGGTTAALATILAPEYVLPAALGGAALGALGIGEGSSLLGGGGGGGQSTSPEDARQKLTDTFSQIGLSQSSATQLQNDFTLLTAQGISPDDAMAAVLQSAQGIQAQDAQDERRRGAALGQQAVIGNFMNPVIEGSTSLQRTPAGRSVLAALSNQAHSIPLVQEYQAEQARQSQGMGSSGISAAQLAALAGQGQ